MLKKRNLIFICLLILGVFLITSCLPKPPVTEGILKGQVIVPEGTLQEKDLTGQALPDATVNIIDPATGDIIATTTTDVNGYYQVFVPAGGPYLLQVVKDGVVILQITPQVEVGIEYDLGTADCSTTAVALIALAMMDAEDYPDDLADINLADIEADPDFDDVMNPVCSTIEAVGDPTESAAIEQAVEDFLYPPAPIPPTPTYTVSFNSQGGSTVSSQTVTHGGKVTEPTAPIWAGHTFGGWYEEPECTNAWDFNTDTVTSDVTLYAKWMGSVHNTTQDIYYTAIQPALNAAATGDNIEVNDGTYAESITFPNGMLITLKSVNGASSTFITGDNDSATVTCIDSLQNTTLEGFTITHNSGYTGKGITIAVGYLTINNCTISDNSVTADYGGGIYNNCGTLTITDSEISGNSSADYAGGIYNEQGTIIITNSTISGNSSANYAGGIHNWSGTLTITSSTISDNSSAADGGGIYNEHGIIIITSSTISDNSVTADYGGGIYNEDTLTITDSEISGNSAPDGGGIYHWYGDLTITGGTISGNTATNGDGGGIYNGIGDLIITGGTISGNTASLSGGGIYIYNSSPTIKNNTISDNTASTGNGGGIYIESGSPTIGGVNESDFNIICGNTPLPQINPDSYPNNYIFTNCDVIGETGPAGGLIFYDKGSVSDGWRYLEAAPASTESTLKQWGSMGTLIGGTGLEIGDGQSNTTIIVTWLNNNTDDTRGDVTYKTDRAAYLCDALVTSEVGYAVCDDWFLPSKDELNLMYTNLKVAGIGGFVESATFCTYWSSSEYDADEAWYQNFYNGDQSHYYDKNSSKLVRAARAF